MRLTQRKSRNSNAPRYNSDTLGVTYRGRTLADVLNMSMEVGRVFFPDQATIARKISVLNGLGLRYLKLGHLPTILSGREAQRIKLAAELGKLKRSKHNLYILDEPTAGLHCADIDRLLISLNCRVDAGHSVIVIEHKLDVIKTADYVIKTADYVIDLGHEGGELIATGTPEQIAALQSSYTGDFLKAGLQKG